MGSVPRAPRATRSTPYTQGPGSNRQAPEHIAERRDLEEAVRFCIEISQDGGESAIAQRAAEYVSEETWKALLYKYRSGGCDDLAKLARQILEGKKKLHDLVARAAGGLLGILGRSRIERLFAQEVARNIPLPMDGKLAAAARGLQIAGIYICLVGDQQISECACMQDVVKTEGKARFKKLLESSIEDWRHVPGRMIPASGSD